MLKLHTTKVLRVFQQFLTSECAVHPSSSNESEYFLCIIVSRLFFRFKTARNTSVCGLYQEKVSRQTRKDECTSGEFEFGTKRV